MSAWAEKAPLKWPSAGDGCDDGDPATGTSACDKALESRGVATKVTVSPEVVVPSTESPKDVKIPVTVEVPAGNEQTTVVLQGFVDCADVAPALQPKKCGSVVAVTAGYAARLESVFLRVTPRIKRGLGRTTGRAVIGAAAADEAGPAVVREACGDGGRAAAAGSLVDP